MSHDELIEELAREHRYRHVLVVSAVIGVLASAALGIFAVGEGATTADRSTFGMFVLPLAASMVIGGGIHRALLSRGRRKRPAR